MPLVVHTPPVAMVGEDTEPVNDMGTKLFLQIVAPRPTVTCGRWCTGTLMVAVLGVQLPIEVNENTMFDRRVSAPDNVYNVATVPNVEVYAPNVPLPLVLQAPVIAPPDTVPVNGILAPGPTQTGVTDGTVTTTFLKKEDI